MSVRTSPRSINGAHEFSNSLVTLITLSPSEVEESSCSTLRQQHGIRRFRCAPLRMTAHVKKPESRIRSGFFEILPRRCRSGGSPVPFSNGWMTVVAASDFQSRPVIFCGRHSLLVSNSGSGITPRNLEHRRVNVRSRNQSHFGTAERAVGRELREKHWFSSQPSTNGSVFKELFPQPHSQLAL